jgi:hypothetical protein
MTPAASAGPVPINAASSVNSTVTGSLSGPFHKQL